MTMLMLAAPVMGLPPMPIGNMLGDFLHVGPVAGWGMHFAIGTVLALGYALREDVLPWRGHLFGCTVRSCAAFGLPSWIS